MRPSWNQTPEQPPVPQVALPRMTPVAKRLILLNAFVFVVSFLLSLVNGPAYDAIVQHLALTPLDWREGFPLVPVWQILTYGFLHSVDSLGHVGGNLLTLYFFGTMLEEILGGRRFLLTYMCAQLVGALFFLIPGIAAASPGAAVGASGAVYGVMIATATLRPRTLVYLLFIPLTLKVLALGILGITLFDWLLTLKHGSDGVAHLIHLGGIAYGFAAAKWGWIEYDPVAAFRSKRAMAAIRQAESDEERMDQLLEKIHREGMGTLTRGEREFLKRASTRK